MQLKDGMGNKDKVFNKNCHSINTKSIQRMKRYTQIKLPSSRGMMAFAVIALPTLPPRAVIDGRPAGQRYIHTNQQDLSYWLLRAVLNAFLLFSIDSGRLLKCRTPWNSDEFRRKLLQLFQCNLFVLYQKEVRLMRLIRCSLISRPRPVLPHWK